jgi:hypothetical protein
LLNDAESILTTKPSDGAMIREWWIGKMWKEAAVA